MALLITVTLAGGTHLGPVADTPITLNADKIVRIDDVGERDLGTSIISLDNDTRLYVTETQAQLQVLANGS